MVALVVLPLHLPMLTDLPTIGVASTVQRVDASQPFPLMTFASSSGVAAAVKGVQALKSLCPQTSLLLRTTTNTTAACISQQRMVVCHQFVVVHFLQTLVIVITG